MVCVCDLSLSGARCPMPLQKRSRTDDFCVLFRQWTPRGEVNSTSMKTKLCQLKLLSSWCTRIFTILHRLGEPAADQLSGHLEQGISERHTQPCRAAVLRWHLWLQWRSHALIYKLDNICSSSDVWFVCVICLHAGLNVPCPHKTDPETGHCRVLFRWFPPLGIANSTSMKTILTVWTTNIV